MTAKIQGGDRIDVLSLPPHAVTALHRFDVHTIRDLVSKDGYYLLDARGFGVVALAAVIARLREHGLELKEPPVPLPDLPSAGRATSAALPGVGSRP